MTSDVRAQKYLLRARARAAAVVGGCLTIVAVAASPAQSAPTFIVNSSIKDLTAAAPLDSGPCETSPGNGVCTLRAAIMKANHFPGGGATITFGLPGAVTYFLGNSPTGTDDETTGDLNITASMNIVGNGAANTVIDGNGAVLGDRVFEIDPGVTVTISGVTIQHGLPSSAGGGVFNNGNLTLDHCAIINNTLTGTNVSGGGIFSDGNLSLTNSVVSGNQISGSIGSGGGVYSYGPLFVLNSTISNNVATGANTVGGGIYAVDTHADIRDSTISGNTAQAGGGIYTDGPPLAVVNSTISGNHANANGGGIYASSGTTGLYNATITLNRANANGSAGNASGGGIFIASGATVNFINSIVASNEVIVHMTPLNLLAENQCSGTLTSQGSNLVYPQDATLCTINGAVSYLDPNLGPLQNNGGLTPTHALSGGSPAIDAGDAGGCNENHGALLATDQRDSPRPWPTGGHCDLGAFELGPLSTLDIDLSNSATKYDAPTDGLLALRYMFGLRGAALTAGVLGNTATRTNPAAIATYLDSIRIYLDVDGDNTADALTDGLLLIRYLSGVTGPALISGAVGKSATRRSATDIQTWIQSLMP